MSELNIASDWKVAANTAILSHISPIGARNNKSVGQQPKFNSVMFGEKKEKKVIDLIERICETVNINNDGSGMSKKAMDDRADEWAEQGADILTEGGDDTMDPAFYNEVEEYFKLFEVKEDQKENHKQFEKIEDFVQEEKSMGRKRRETARLLAASEEVRIAAEFAGLKAYRMKQVSATQSGKLQEKIADAEKSYVNRKMVIAKASQVANTDCRNQFKRVREFFQSLHENRKKTLREQYHRSVKIQAVLHRLRKTDKRVRSLEQNTVERIFRKKESDMVELNMIQNLEEASYLENIIILLDSVQEAKEVAADEYFQMQIRYLKQQHKSIQEREKELVDFRAKSMLDMAELIARYVKEEMQDREEDEQTKEMVERTERTKDFEGSNSKVLLSVSDLYDTILWSVATGSIGISSSDSESFDSYDDEDEEEEEAARKQNQSNNSNSNSLDDDLTGVDSNKGATENQWQGGGNDTASVQSASTANTTDVNTSENLSPIGHIFVKELRREIRQKERKMEKIHAAEHKAERKAYRAEARRLKEKHQGIVDALLARCVEERARLRDTISRRMLVAEQKQSSTTQTLQEATEADVSAMQQAWAEHKRLEEEKKGAFAKAQALVSAQVFHEVRNALSSVVAMSEMTSSLQKDPSVNSETLIDSVSEMLDQNKEVVNYSLNMLNNILDVSKIKAGSFETQKSFFDLQDLVNRATTMQLVKAQTRGVKMSFKPTSDPQIAYSDADIVVRIITNFISNAVKFTTAGAVQPFVCPLEQLDPAKDNEKPKKIRLDHKKKPSPPKKQSKSIKKVSQDSGKKETTENEATYTEVKYVAVGVADTGPGLSRALLGIAEAGLFNSDGTKMNSGAKNSGFGLHLAHQLAGTLGSEVNLTDLETFRKFWNVDMTSAMNTDSSSVTSDGSVYSEDTPGKGTVLYITIPVISDVKKAKKKLKGPQDVEEALDMAMKKYVFSPQPAPNSVDGCFRILVADDVAMLRKGLMRSVLDIFKEISDCPISVSTACTAEDALRAIGSNNYDLFICDNQFAPPTHLNRMPPESDEKRNQVNSRGNMVDVRRRVMSFFKSEAFTITPGDGSLSGIDALLQLAKARTPSINIPVLVLHSGHQLELPKEHGIIVVRKPLKRNDFVPLFERNAQNLIDTGMCVEDKRGDKVAILNRGGAQLFMKQSCVEVIDSEVVHDDVCANTSVARKRSSANDKNDRDEVMSPLQKKQKPSKEDKG
eukprot:CAMPEP_0197173990 /NCGR_PEP_ID=MMETSP1423-20130617/707_1 /TAXON_ID=476441 /ORGANISM="Pseudo-nitzschia heimii, Strain UNC1101" /LENGTH=1224 /DNA_ID=CAMNT_0042622879 /DNA_START=231 /DNA_END=3905 /DNA_ORIENTATION=+